MRWCLLLARVLLFTGTSTWPSSWSRLCLSTWYSETRSTLWVMLLPDTWGRLGGVRVGAGARWVILWT